MNKDIIIIKTLHKYNICMLLKFLNYRTFLRVPLKKTFEVSKFKFCTPHTYFRLPRTAIKTRHVLQARSITFSMGKLYLKVISSL